MKTAADIGVRSRRFEYGFATGELNFFVVAIHFKIADAALGTFELHLAFPEAVGVRCFVP